MINHIHKVWFLNRFVLGRSIISLKYLYLRDSREIRRQPIVYLITNSYIKFKCTSIYSFTPFISKIYALYDFCESKRGKCCYPFLLYKHLPSVQFLLARNFCQSTENMMANHLFDITVSLICFSH